MQQKMKFFISQQTLRGNKVDYGELPQIIFQPNTFKNALQMILRTTDELQV